MKYAIIFALSLLLFSCSYDLNDDKVTISKREYDALRGDSLALKYPKTFSVGKRTYEIELGTDGHEYYSMQIGTGGYSAAIRDFHYPSCELCTKPQKYEVSKDTLQKD